MAPSPASRNTPNIPNVLRTPASVSKHKERHRLAVQSPSLPSASPSSDHPVEVVGRIRNHAETSERASVLQVLNHGQMVRVKTEQGYRDFGLDGASLAENEDLQGFYNKYVESRIEMVKMGGRCTIMMYGPTGAGKSYTMFGTPKEPGIAYRALHKILGGVTEERDCDIKKVAVNVSILEIYNEEAFDLLATCSSNTNGNWIKPSKVRLEIFGKKPKNAVSITGSDAGKISNEIAKVEKRRVVKSTFCNDRSSRSHCLVMVDVPALGGRLVLVDMAGSENLEQAGLGMESKLQTGKINQGNIALKRVVEAIANNDSYIPFRDSKLTMLLQDSFEDDESKILMILCASNDPKDMHKTMATLEYGAKAKCIVRLPTSPEHRKTNLDKMDPSALEAKLQEMDLYVSKLEAENLNKDREREEIKKTLMSRDYDLVTLKKMLKQMEQVREKCDYKVEMEKKVEDCQRMTDELIELGNKSLEGMMKEQQREIDMMRCRMEEIEREVQLLLKVNQQPCHTEVYLGTEEDHRVAYGNRLVATSDEKSMDMDIASSVIAQPVSLNDEPLFKGDHGIFSGRACASSHDRADIEVQSLYMQDASDITAEEEFYEKTGWLPAIPEELEGEEEMAESEAVQISLQCGNNTCDVKQEPVPYNDLCLSTRNTTMVQEKQIDDEPANRGLTTVASRRSRIETIFFLCGNQRELTGSRPDVQVPKKPIQKHMGDHGSANGARQRFSSMEKPSSTSMHNSPAHIPNASVLPTSSPRLKNPRETSPSHHTPARTKQSSTDENTPPQERCRPLLSPAISSASRPQSSSKSPKRLSFDGLSPDFKASNESQQDGHQDAKSCEVYLKWETSKESSGKLIKILHMKQDATLASLRKEVESIALETAKHDFSFLMLGDPSGAPIKREDEGNLVVSALPDCNKKQGTKLACLRPHSKHALQSPFTPVENKISRISSSLWGSTTPDAFHHLKSPDRALAYQIEALTPHSTETCKSKPRLNFTPSPLLRGLRL